MVRNFKKCIFCDENHSDDTYSKHILNNHDKEVFSSSNLQRLLNYNLKGFNHFAIQFEVDKKDIYFVPCCKKFFSSKVLAHKHLKDNKDCRDCVKQKAKDIYDEYSSLYQINNITNNQQINNIVNNNLFLDLSGNNVPLSPEALKAILKELIVTINCERRDKATLYKNNVHLKTKCGDNYSECSEAESYYSDCDEPVSDEEKVVRRYSFSKEASKVMKKFNIPKELVSTRSLEIRGKKEHLERKRIQDAEKQFNNDLVQEQKSEKRASINSEIKAKEDKIDFHKDNMKHFSGLINTESSGITQKIYDEEYDKTKEIKKLEEEISQLRKELKTL